MLIFIVFCADGDGALLQETPDIARDRGQVNCGSHKRLLPILTTDPCQLLPLVQEAIEQMALEAMHFVGAALKARARNAATEAGLPLDTNDLKWDTTNQEESRHNINLAMADLVREEPPKWRMRR